MKKEISHKYKAGNKYTIKQNGCLLYLYKNDEYVGLLCFADIQSIKEWRKYYGDNH